MFEKSVFSYHAEVLTGTGQQIEQRLNDINNNKELSLVFTSNLVQIQNLNSTEKVNVDEQGKQVFTIVIQTKKMIRGFSR